MLQRGTLDALDELDQMASMPKLKLMANWVVKLGDLKTSAASSMAKFPLHTVGLTWYCRTAGLDFTCAAVCLPLPFQSVTAPAAEPCRVHPPT